MRNLIPFLPEELFPVLLVCAGLALIVGARQLAGAIMVVVLASIFLPVLVAPFFDLMPTWLLILVLIFFCLSVIRLGFDLLIGRRATNHMVGNLAADVVKFAFFTPFRFLNWGLGLLFRR